MNWGYVAIALFTAALIGAVVGFGACIMMVRRIDRPRECRD